MNQNKEKLESELYQQYQKAIDDLESGDAEQGKIVLKKLMESPAIIFQDDKKILYGIYMSLAEILAQSPSIKDKCEALYYYNQSNQIIENCWQIFRKMAILFRQLGMLPKALNTILKALQLCNQNMMHTPMLYQTCCICFMMNEKAQFFKYYNLIPQNDSLKKKLAELSAYISGEGSSIFVEELLTEQKEIPQKLELIPLNDFETQFFNQQFEYILKIDTFYLQKFFKKIKNILQFNVNIEPKKQDFIQNEKSLLTNTVIIIEPKQSQQKKKILSKDCPKESQAPIKQSERQKSKKSKQQQDQQFVLDQTILLNHKKIIESVRQIDGSEIFEANSNNKATLESLKKHECPLAKFLLERMSKQKYLTIIAVLNELINLLLNEFLPKENEQSYFNEALRGLINCVVWAQYSTNNFTSDPRIKLRLLELAYDELNLRCRLKKAKSPEQHNKIKNYNRFISQLKLELLQINIKQILTDEKEIAEYLNKYYRLMAQIHSDINFFVGRIAKCSANFLNDLEITELVQEKIKAAKVQISTSSPHQSQQINQIITQWELKEQKLEDNEKIRTQMNCVIEYLKQNQCGDITKRFAMICLHQFYFAQSKDDLKGIQQFLQPLLSELLNIHYSDLPLGFLFLKFSLVYSLMDLDSSEFIRHFLEILINEVNIPKKQSIIIEVLQLDHLNLMKLFTLLNIDLVSKEFVTVKLKLREKNEDLINYFKANIQSDVELNYYLLHLLDQKVQQTPKFFVEKNSLQVEVVGKNDSKVQPDSFTSASEDEFIQPNIFSSQYKQIGLTSDQIETSFKIQKKQYQYSIKTIDFLQNHSIQINIGDPIVIDHIKRLAKESVRNELGFCTKELSECVGKLFFNNYYFIADIQRELSDTEMQLIGYFLPHCQKFVDQKLLNQFLLQKVKPDLMKQINLTVLKYAEQLYHHIFDKQPKQITQTLKELYDNILTNNFQSDYRSNLFYLIEKAEEQNETKQIADFKNMCFALAYKDSAFLWNQFYLSIFEQAENQFLSKIPSDIDWFLSQKKTQALVNKNIELSHLFEYRYVMDLLKAQQRQMEYQMQQTEQTYLKTQSAYECLYKSKQSVIPQNALELQYNFRVMQLYEKKIIRKYKYVTLEKIKQNIENIYKLRDLICQMRQYDLDYFFQSKDGDAELEQDLYINLYKFIRRYLRRQQYSDLNELIVIIKEKVPQLCQPAQFQYEFSFPNETRSYKLQNCASQRGNQEEKLLYSTEINQILNNLLSIFQQNVQKFIKKKVQRFVVEAYYYSTHLKFHSNVSIDDIFSQIQPIYQPNSKDLVYYYKQIDKYQSEKDEVLSHYYYHDLVFSYQKSKILKLIIKILLIQQKYKEIYLLFEKLNKVFDLRLYQACVGLMINYASIEDKILIRDIINKIESYRRTNELFKQESIAASLNDMYIKFYEKEQQSLGLNEFQQETKEKKLEKGKKIFEEFRATKRKSTKPKTQQQPQSQQLQQSSQQLVNQPIIDDIEQFITQVPTVQQFHEDDNF